jgi:uroporphyrinogen III methyltransferase/synthase
VRFEVVPGITSAIAVPAYAGIPVTLRHSSTAFTVVTGHEDPDKSDELDWGAVARVGGTIVVLMGVGRLRRIVERLMSEGLAPETPVAVIRWGTRPEQSTLRATLGTVLEHEDDLEPPATIVIGAVAGLDLRWYEDLPLLGHRVVVTRTRGQASGLSSLLRQRGAHPVEVPTIEIVEPEDGGEALRRAAETVSGYDWIVFTSANGAERFLGLLRDARALGGTKIAAIGPATTEVIRAFNVVADLVPDRYVAEALLDVFPSAGTPPGRVLLPRAAVARDVLPDGLRSLGWDVEVVDAYRTVPATIDAEGRRAVAEADIVTFTSSSTVENFVTAYGRDHLPEIVACIGPITAQTARGLGLRVDVEAAEHTIPGLVEALEDHLGRA